MLHTASPSRRSFLIASAVLPVASGLNLPAALASTTEATKAPYPTVSSGTDRYTRAVGQKFYPDGRVRPFPGCTILSHVQTGSSLQKALFDVLDQAATHPVMKKFSLMPRSSLHMTLMDGIDDAHRAVPLWPHAIPVTAALQDCIEWCSHQMDGFRTERTADFQMVRRDIAIEKLNSFTVHLKPANALREQEMRGIRDRLSDRLEIREPGHDTYGFHITLGYLVEYLTPDEALEFYRFYLTMMDGLFAAIPEITIGQPEFCTFSDMFAFEKQFYLQD